MHKQKRDLVAIKKSSSNDSDTFIDYESFSEEMSLENNSFLASNRSKERTSDCNRVT